jgi:hypothetical protein
MILGLTNIAHMCNINVTWKSQLLQCYVSSSNVHEMMMHMIMNAHDDGMMQGKH